MDLTGLKLTLYENLADPQFRAVASIVAIAAGLLILDGLWTRLRLAKVALSFWARCTKVPNVKGSNHDHRA